MSSLIDDNVTLTTMTDPINLQQLVLDDIGDRLTGNKVIVDPNSTSMLLIEMGANLTSNLAKATEDAISSWLAKRSLTSEDLYKHMSDYDYVNLYSAPSTCHIKLHLDKDYILRYAQDFNNYKLLVIPETTVFRLGNLDFGIYYPIHLRIRKVGDSEYVLAVWDTTQENNLHTLRTNYIQTFEWSYLGMTLIQLTIPVYQFTRTQYVSQIVPNSGFAQEFAYTDSFYAARLFTPDPNDNTKLIELHQELGKDTYNPDVATARIQAKLDTNTLSVNIPQIYMTNGLIGGKLITEIYTTKGNIEPAVGSLEETQLSLQFNNEYITNNYRLLTDKNDVVHLQSEYTQLLSSLPTCVLSVESDKASGGNDGYSFEELRKRVVNSSFHTTALITPIDLENYFYDKGFKIVKYQDDLTNLTYFAYRLLKDSVGNIIPSANLDVVLTEKTPYYDPINTDKDDTEKCSTIRKFTSDKTMTVLPSTLYKYDPSTLTCTPITDAERKSIEDLSVDKTYIADLFNNTKYTKSPFHYRLIYNSRYPYVSSYDLMTPSISNLKFTYENPYTIAQMTVAGITIVHMSDGDRGYKIRVVCQQSQDLYQVDESNIKVLFFTKDNNGTVCGQLAKSIAYEDGIATYDLDIDTDYHINIDHELNLTSFRSSADHVNDYYTELINPTYINADTGNAVIPNTFEESHFVELEQEFGIAFLVNKSVCDIEKDDSAGYSDTTLLKEYNEKGYVIVSKQSLKLKLGRALDDVIYNNINLQWSSTQYKTYQKNVLLTYEKDEYDLDENGVPKYKLITNTDGTQEIEFTKIHSAGDIVYDDTGKPMYKYKKGDIIYGPNGLPETTDERALKYTIQVLMIDAKLYVSETQSTVNYIKEIPELLETYFNTIEIATDSLLERDKLYFKPLKTIGNAVFDVGNGITTTIPLEISVSFKVYLDNEAYSSSELKNKIKDNIIEIVEDNLNGDRVSLTEIANKIKEQIIHIESIDVLGINDNIELQTLTIIDESVKPYIRQDLYVTDDNYLDIRKAVDIEFLQANAY